MSQDPGLDFGAFYEHWFDRVFNYARHRTGSAARADEIVADTFTRALKAWPKYDPNKGEASTWLFSIAFRAVADHYRSEKRLLFSNLDEAPEAAERGPAPGQRLEEAQTKAELAKALQRLEEQPREIVALRFYAGMTNRAIGGLLGLSESNVAVILFRSVRKLRQNFPGVEA